MSVEEPYKERYKTGATPWDIDKPDFNLIAAVNKTPIKPRKALDIRCGTGDNSVWLVQQNFQVIGTDISEIAIEKAKEKASKPMLSVPLLWLISLRTKSKARLSALPLIKDVFIQF